LVVALVVAVLEPVLGLAAAWVLVLAVEALVEDTLNPAKAVISKVQKLFESCQLTVGSSTNTVSDESKKKLKELVQKVAASDRLLKQKTGAIVRQVEDMKAKVESKALEAELTPLDEAVNTMTENANKLDSIEEKEIEKACEAVNKEITDLREKLDSILARVTSATAKSQSPTVKQVLAKIRQKCMATTAKLKRPSELVDKAPAAAKLRAQVAHVSKPVVEIEAEAAKVLELHKELIAKLKDVLDSGLSEEAAKTVAGQMESLASKTREKVTGIRETITKALEDESGEVKAEVTRLQRRAEAIDVKMRSAQIFAGSAGDKATGNAKVRVIKTEAEKLEKTYAELLEKFTPLSTSKLRTELGMDKVAETLAEAAAIDTLRAAIPGQLEAFSAVSTEKFQPPIEVRKRLEDLLGKADQLNVWRADAVEAVELVKCRKALAALKEAQTALKDASLFAKIHGEASGHVSAAEFAKYWTKSDIAPAEKVFEYMNAKGTAEGISEAEFTALVKDMYTCASGIALTDEFVIGKSKVVRTLEVGEKLEVLEGPKQEETTKVDRIKVLCPKDKATGWVTVQGNHGTVYCEPTSGEKQLLALDQATMQRRKMAAAAAKLEKDAKAKLDAAVEATADVEKQFLEKLQADTVQVSSAATLAAQAKKAHQAAKNGAVKVAQQAVMSLKRVSKDGASTKACEEKSEDCNKRLAEILRLATELPARVKALAAEREKRRTDAVAKLRAAAAEKGADAYAQSLAKDDKVTCEAVGKALAAIGEKYSESELKYVFEAFTKDETCTVAVFGAQLRAVYRCITQVGIQDDISIGKSKIVATLLVGDLVEGLQDPVQDPGAKVMRLKLKTMKDSKTGWGTLKGNQGTTYLEELTFEELRSMAAEEQEAANGKEEEKAEPMEGVVEEKAEKAEVKAE